MWKIVEDFLLENLQPKLRDWALEEADRVQHLFPRQISRLKNMLHKPSIHQARFALVAVESQAFDDSCGWVKLFGQ